MTTITTKQPPPSSRLRRARHTVGLALLTTLALLASLVAGVFTVAPANAATPTTIVSLTFDDGNADLMTAAPILQKYNMHGTFYVISGVVGAPNYFTLANLATLKAAGNEIGGHTVTHPDLTTVPVDEVTRQICNDRVNLASWGYTPTDFAYPYAAFNSTIEGIAKSCGYNSARSLGDIASAHGCTGCALAETIPPADPYNLAAVDEIDNTWTLAQMESVVTKAQKAGGWVPFTFHHICTGTGCDSLSISPANFDAFLLWLSKRPSTTKVQTVQQVIGGPVNPVVSGPPAPTTAQMTNPSLETPGSSGYPQCWMPAGYGTNTATFSTTTAAHTGTAAETLAMAGYASGDAKLLPAFDTGACTPTVTAGSTYTVSTWYKSTVVTQYDLYYRNAQGFWYYATSSPWFAAAPTYAQATWVTPAIPAGITGISFGLNLFSNGSLTTDDYSITQASAAAPVAASVLVAARSAARTAPQGIFSALLAGRSLASAVPQVVLGRPVNDPNAGRHGHHPTWGPHSRPEVFGKNLKPNTRIALPFLPD